MTTEQSDLLISVIIPVKNGSAWLDDTIPAILNQKISGQFEILVIDSGSTDNTLSIIEKYPIRLIQIDPEEFNHGLTRNIGVRESKGKYVVMTVQDAKPLTSEWLQELLNGFLDESVAGVCGQQIVPHHRDKNPVEWFRPISKPEIRKYQFADKNLFKNLTPDKQLALCLWDDVNAMYRRDILIKLPFQKTDFAEDALWAKDALLAGYSIVYNTIAQVAHYHQEDYQYAFKRNFIDKYHLYKYFKVVPESKIGIKRYLSIIKLLLRDRKISFSDKIKWFKYNYQSLKAVNKSNSLLMETLSKGDDTQLDNLYNKTILSIPQAPSTKCP